MTNYNQVNIYRRQMNELKLNPRQYAQLINMPYEVVKDFLYDKDGNYSKEIRDTLREIMIQKHQEIENNFENSKYKGMEIRRTMNVNYLDWYEKEYTWDRLKDKLNINKIVEFENKYYLTINGQKASHWIYSLLISKKEYKGKAIALEKKIEFIRQLYDILENDNANEYLATISDMIPKKTTKTINDDFYFAWYKDFDVKKFMKQHGLTNTLLGKEIDLGVVSTSNLVSKKFYTRKTLKKLYNYVNNISTTQNDDISTIADNINKVIKEQVQNDVPKLFDKDIDVDELMEQEPVITYYQEPSIQLVNTNDDILRKILINRLTDEEKELIRIFGGKLC